MDNAASDFPDFHGWEIPDGHCRSDSQSVRLFHDARTGRFPQNFADEAIRSGVAAGLGVDRAYLEQYGAELWSALRVRGNYAKVQVTLQRLIRRLVKDTWRGRNVKAAEYFLHYTFSMQALLARRRHSGGGKLPRVFGLVIGAIEQLRLHKLKPTPALVCKVVQDRAGVSATDIENAISAYTSDAGLTLADWLVRLAMASVPSRGEAKSKSRHTTWRLS